MYAIAHVLLKALMTAALAGSGEHLAACAFDSSS